MSKTINLIAGLIALVNVIYSFWGNQDSASIFGFSMNIWLYRAIWGLLAVVLLYGYVKARKMKS